jgi:protein TonB
MQKIIALMGLLGLAIASFSGCAAGAPQAEGSLSPSQAGRPTGGVAACPGYENLATATLPDGRSIVTAFDSLARVSSPGRQGVRLDGRRGPSAADSMTNRLLGVQVAQPVGMDASQLRSLAQQMEQLYPANLRQAGIGGEVVLLVLIDAQGAVRQTRVGRSSGYNDMDGAAVTLIQRARFNPAIAGGCGVPYVLRLPVSFKTAR